MEIKCSTWHLTRLCNRKDLFTNLRTIIEHRGGDIESGHCLSFARTQDDQWRECNDECVDAVTFEDIYSSEGGDSGQVYLAFSICTHLIGEIAESTIITKGFEDHTAYDLAVETDRRHHKGL